jgi:nitroreductase
MVATQSPLVASALDAAVRAPSPYNTQPWLFETGPGGIDVVLDEGRVLEVADPDGGEARVACGAGLKNIESTIAAAGHAGQVLRRVLLAATGAGICASFLSQPVEIPSIRAELRTLLGGAYPRTVLRLGYGFAGASTPGRPASAVTRSRP